jgi:hypothetical protein
MAARAVAEAQPALADATAARGVEARLAERVAVAESVPAA